VRPDQIAAWISESRFRSYLEASGGDHDRAVALYKWNAEISAAFLEILCHLEVLFRNSIDRQFPDSDPTAALSILRADCWLSDPELLTLDSREKVNDAIARLDRIEKRPTRDQVIASLSFGFWQALFAGAYEDLWRTTLASRFPNGNGRRRQIAGLSGHLLHFRNRIAHHEAIFSGSLGIRHDEILELAGLIDADADAYIGALSRVRPLLLQRP
jgi:Abi-like protein